MEMIRLAMEASGYRQFQERIGALGTLGKFSYDTKYFQKAFPSKERFDEMTRFAERVKAVEDRLKKIFRYPAERERDAE